MNNRRHRWLILIGFSIISACSSAGLPEQEQLASVQQIDAPTDLPATISTAIPAAITPKVEVAQEIEIPAVKTELEATDPGSVSLVNGRPTFVEFFAFW